MSTDKSVNNFSADEKKPHIRNYKILRSTWLVITLFVFLALVCTLILSTILLALGQSIGMFDVPIRMGSPSFITFIIASVLIGTVLSTVFARVIVNPINNLRRATRKVSSGDFTVQLPVTSNSEIAQLTNDFNLMVRELGSIETLRNDFVANVSHEFKTPISSIEGYASLLQGEDVTDEERVEYARSISDSARKLSVLTTNILRLSKLENQDFVCEQTTYSLDEQIRRCILLFEREWTNKNIELDIDLEPTIITGCEELLEEVWQNLISNAIKFTDPGGTIGITLTSSSECVVKIKDNGIGMDESVIPHIFDKFYQSDRSRSRQGNGLGLTLVKQILDTTGGRIEVKSAPGEGSEFTVTLPIYK